MESATLRTRALENLKLCAASEPDDNILAEPECDHFSIRGYVALLQKKDPKLCSLSQKYSLPSSVAKYRRWNCSNCLDKVKSSDHKTTSGTVPMEQDATDADCSISFVRTLPKNNDSRRPFSCTQQSSQGNDADRPTLSKSVQECNSKCSSPSGNKGVTVENVPTTVVEKGVPEKILDISVPSTNDLQDSPNNLDLMPSILNDVSVDVNDLPGVPQIMSSKSGNGTQTQCDPKPCEAPNGDENGTTQDVPNIDHNVSNARKPISGHKGSKPTSGHKSSQVRNQGTQRASSKRNVGSNSNKKNKSTDVAGIPDLKYCQRKPKKTRLLSELIDTDQVGGSADATAVYVPHTGDRCEPDKGEMPLEVGNDNDTPASNQKVEEIQTVKDKTKFRGVDNVDEGSSLMNWLKKTHKKVRNEKKDLAHKNADSSAGVSNSNPDKLAPASNDMRHDFLPSDGDLGQKKMLPTTGAKHGNENMQNNNLEQDMQKTDDLCRNESKNCKQRLSSNSNSVVLIKRKVPSNAIARDKNTVNSTVKRNTLRADELCQMESESSVQRCPSKVSLGKRKVQNVSGLHKQKMPKNKKKQKLDMHEKQTLIDDIPMDIVELLARNQHERQLMTETDSCTQPKILAVDSAQIVAKDGPLDAAIVVNTDSQKSLGPESEQINFDGHASSSTAAPNAHPLELHVQCRTEAPTGLHQESQMQSSLQVHASSISSCVNVYPPKLHIPDFLECTQEQQTHFCSDEEVTIACTSPIFSHHQHIADLPSQSWSNNKGQKKLMWDSFKAAPRNSPTSTYGFQFRNGIQEVDSDSIHVYRSSNHYQAHQPVALAVEPYTKKAADQVQQRIFPSTALTMDAGGLYNQRFAGQSGLYPKEPIPATHLLRLMDPSTMSGFTNKEIANRNRVEFQTVGSQYAQSQYNASPSTSYGNRLNEKVPLTLQDLSRHQVQQNLHRPLRPHPRVGVLGSLLQQDIANWSENCGAKSGYRLGVSKGKASFDMNRKENYETLNSGMFSAGWNALQLGSVCSVANPEYPLPRYGITQPLTSGNGQMVHPLDKLVRKDICQTNRNPAEFTVISDSNEYMINL